MPLIFFSQPYLLFFALLIIDSLTKHLAIGLLTGSPIVINQFLSLRLQYNCGVAFSFFHSCSWQSQYILILLALLISGYLTFGIFQKSHNKTEKMGILLIVAGAVGNIIDRIYYGHVVDFILLHYESFYWPTFNIADTFITLGVITALLSSVKRTQSNK